MAKKPKGLVKSQAAKKDESGFDLSSIMILDQDSYHGVSDSFKDYKTMSADFRYKGFDLACDLAREIAKESLGYTHSSDVLDSAPDFEFKEFAGLGRHAKRPAVSYDSDESDDYEESSDDDEIGYRHDHYDQVKEKFKEKLNEAIGTGSLSNFESFKQFLSMAKTKGFTGNEADFENALKSSEEFRRLCKNMTTNYTG